MTDANVDGSHGWERSDAWVFTAIVITDGGEGSSLADVVAAGDAVNHAIFLERELEQGGAPTPRCLAHRR
jgi:hypothetical protein